MKRQDPVRFAAIAAIAACLTTGSGSALAQGSASAAMAVSIEVTPNCTVAAGPLAFGTVTATSAPSASAVAAIEVSCAADVPFTVQLDDGQNASGGARRALDPASGAYLSYEIYADPAHTRRWGSLKTQAFAGVTTATGIERLTAYGQVGSGAEVKAGRYGDLVTVTTNF